MRDLSPGSARISTAAVLAILAVAATLACSTASVMPPQETPVVESIGDGVVRFGGQDVWVVVDYRYARTSAGQPWLLLDVGATAADGRQATIERSKVFVRSPSGRRYPLATQKEVTQARTELANQTRRATVAGSASYDFPGSRQPCRFDFFVTQSQRRQVAFDEVYVNDSRACFERLYFNVPDRIEAGKWVLGIDLEQSEVRVPFDL